MTNTINPAVNQDATCRDVSADTHHRRAAINPHDAEYHRVFTGIYVDGHDHDDRTGHGRRSLFGTQARFDISDGTVPILTTRNIFTRGMIEELLWFISGNSNSVALEEKGVNIWNPWALRQEHLEKMVMEQFPETPPEQLSEVVNHLKNEEMLREGTIGPMYGALWRNAPNGEVYTAFPKLAMVDYPCDKISQWIKEYEVEKKAYAHAKEECPSFESYCHFAYYRTVDQLNNLVVGLKQRPYSSRHCVTAWIPQYVPFETITPQDNILLGKGALAACHAFFQCLVAPPKEEGGKKRLSLHLTIRSNDAAVGKCYNVPQYSILLAMLAHVTDMEPHEFILSVGDDHLYLSHMETTNPDLTVGIETQLKRESYAPPKLWLNPYIRDLFVFTIDDIKILDYQCHGRINYAIAE